MMPKFIVKLRRVEEMEFMIEATSIAAVLGLPNSDEGQDTLSELAMDEPPDFAKYKVLSVVPA